MTNGDKRLVLNYFPTYGVGETGASCYTGKLLQSRYLARWCIDEVANV